MASGLLIDYLGHGDIADRPASLSLHTGALGLWWSDDTSELSLWDGAAWIENVGAGVVTSVNGATGNVVVPVPIGLACSDETTAITAGAAKTTFRMPHAFTLTGVRASLTTAQASGSIFTVDINEGGVSVLSTKITIDNGAKTSVGAATPPVISDGALADDAEMTVDVDQVGDGTATGLKVWLIGYKP